MRELQLIRNRRTLMYRDRGSHPPQPQTPRSSRGSKRLHGRGRWGGATPHRVTLVLWSASHESTPKSAHTARQGRGILARPSTPRAPNSLSRRRRALASSVPFAVQILHPQDAHLVRRSAPIPTSAAGLALLGARLAFSLLRGFGRRSALGVRWSR